MGLFDLPKEPLCRVCLAVLLLTPIGVLYLFRSERDHLRKFRMDKCRLDDLMGELERVALFLFHLPAKTGGAADMVGGEVPGTIYGAEVIVAEYPVLFYVLAPLEETEEDGEETFEFFWVYLVHDDPHLRVGRDGVYRPDVREIGGHFFRLHPVHELQKRGVLVAEHGKRAHAHVLQLMVHLLPLPMVGDTGEVLEQHVPYSREPKMQGCPHGKDDTTSGQGKSRLSQASQAFFAPFAKKIFSHLPKPV